MSFTTFSVRTFKQCVSWLTLLCFVGTGIPAPVEAGRVPEIPAQPLLPYSYGRITHEAFVDGRRVVVYIQDLHCNPEAQENIARILHSLDEQVGISRIFLEGAPAGKVDAVLYRTVTDTSLRDRALERLMRKGLLSGAEYYGLRARKNAIFGLEDWDAYTGNLARYRRLAAEVGTGRNTCAALTARIEAVKRAYGDQNLLRLERGIKRAYTPRGYKRLEKIGAHAGEPVGGYPNLARYTAMLRIHRKVSLNRLNKELAAYAAELRARVPLAAYRPLMGGLRNPENRDAYVLQMRALAQACAPGLARRYPRAEAFMAGVQLNTEINPLQLVDEQQIFQERVLVKHARRRLDADMVFLSRMAEELDAMVSLRMTPALYRHFAANRERCAVLLKKYFEDDDIAAVLALLDDPEYRQYYDVNIRRNADFAAAILHAGAGQGGTPGRQASAHSAVSVGGAAAARLAQYEQVDVVVAGGFHLGMVSLLKDKGISCVTVTPSVTKVSEDGLYQRVMTGSLDPREALSSALGPISLLVGGDPARASAAAAALFAEAASLGQAAQIINDLDTDPRVSLSAVYDEARRKMTVSCNGAALLSITENGTGVRVEVVAPAADITLSDDSQPGLGQVTAAVSAAMDAVLEQLPAAGETAVDAPNHKQYGRAIIALLRQIKTSFAHDGTPPQITISDKDESLVEAGAVQMTEGIRDAIIANLEAGGIFVILTGGTFATVQSQILESMTAALDHRRELLSRLFVLTNSGSEQYEYDATVHKFTLRNQDDMAYEIGAGHIPELRSEDGARKLAKIEEIIQETERDVWIEHIFRDSELLQKVRQHLPAGNATDSDDALKKYLQGMTADGAVAVIERRGASIYGKKIISQITFVPPGREVTDEQKLAYDQQGGKLKRELYAEYINWRMGQEGIPAEAKIAGKTSVDIRPIGKDKSYGVGKFLERFAAQSGNIFEVSALQEQVVFIGDSLGRYGNDTPAALIAGTVVHVCQPGGQDPDARLKDKLIGTVEMGTESLVPYLHAIAFMAAVKSAVRDGAQFADLFDWRTLPAPLKKIYALFFSGPSALRGPLMPVRIAARMALHWGAAGARTLTPFQQLMFTDPVLSQTLPGKSLLRAVPEVNPSRAQLGAALKEIKEYSRRHGMFGVAVTLSASPAAPRGNNAGKIVVFMDNAPLILRVIHQEDAAGEVLHLRVPAQYLAGKTSKQQQEFLQTLYPSALASLTEALDNGDIVAQTTGIIPWLLDITGIAMDEDVRAALESLPVVVNDRPGVSRTELAGQYRDLCLNADQITENNAGTGVMRHPALMMRVNINDVRNPTGPSVDPATSAQAFVRQFEGMLSVQFDGVLRMNTDGSVTAIGPVAAALEEIPGGHIVFSVEVPELPFSNDERLAAARRTADGILSQRAGHPDLGVRFMFEGQPDEQAWGEWVRAVAERLRDGGMAPEAQVLFDCANAAQAAIVRAVGRDAGMRGVQAVQRAGSAQASPEDAVEVTIAVGPGETAVPRELSDIMSSNARLVVLRLDGITPAMEEQGVRVNLGMIRSAAFEFIRLREPLNQDWWKERGVQAARAVMANIARLHDGTDAAVFRHLATVMMEVSPDGANLREAVKKGGIDDTTRTLLSASVTGLEKLIARGATDEARAVRSALRAGFAAELLGDALLRQMPEYALLNARDLRASGEDRRIKQFLTAFARADRDNPDIPVQLVQMQAGIVPMPSDEAAIAALKQRVRSYISAHSDDHATVYSVLKCAEALGLGLSSVSERFDVSEKVPVGARPGSAESLLVEFLLDAETLKLDELRNKITAFLNQPDHDSAAQAMALGLYLVLLKAEFAKGLLEQGADAALPAVREVARILSAA